MRGEGKATIEPEAAKLSEEALAIARTDYGVPIRQVTFVASMFDMSAVAIFHQLSHERVENDQSGKGKLESVQQGIDHKSMLRCNWIDRFSQELSGVS